MEVETFCSRDIFASRFSRFTPFVMGSEELIGDHVSSAQCSKALKALYAYATKKRDERDAGELLPSKDEHVWLVVGTKVMHPEKKLKPRRM